MPSWLRQGGLFGPPITIVGLVTTKTIEFEKSFDNMTTLPSMDGQIIQKNKVFLIGIIMFLDGYRLNRIVNNFAFVLKFARKIIKCSFALGEFNYPSERIYSALLFWSLTYYDVLFEAVCNIF